MEWLKYCVDFGVLGLLILLSVISLAQSTRLRSIRMASLTKISRQRETPSKPFSCKIPQTSAINVFSVLAADIDGLLSFGKRFERKIIFRHAAASSRGAPRLEAIVSTVRF